MPRKVKSDDFPELLTGGEAQRLSGLSTGNWMELLETGRLPKPVQVAGRFKWRKADILAWIRNLESVEVFA